MLQLKALPSYETLMEKAQRYPSMNIQVTETFLHVLRAGCALRERVERQLAAFGQSYRRFLLLCLLSRGPEPVPMSRLAEMAGVTTPTISDVVAGMVRDRLVDRVEDARDKRKVRIALRAEGQRILDDMLPRLHAFKTAVMQDLDDQELKTLVTLLSKVRLDAGDSSKEPRTTCDNP
ncbi:hypothetical protein JCM15519_25700 [Fundidesulfovibrio butyratiphilus]